MKCELDDLIMALEIYLEFLMPLKHPDTNYCKDLKAIKQIKEIDPRYVISFNYTYTYKAYGIEENDVFHVHGKLYNHEPDGKYKNNMVLGFDDVILSISLYTFCSRMFELRNTL